MNLLLDYNKKCPICENKKKKYFIKDFHRAEIYCAKCGLVLVNCYGMKFNQYNNKKNIHKNNKEK